MARERQAEEVPGENTYLVCPLRDDTVEAIRAEAYKSREKKTLAQERKAARLRKRELKERRRLREAGELHPDSGISCVDEFKKFNEFTEAFNNPLRYTQFVRRAFYWQLTREQMQRVVARYYGWEKWSEDPWGSHLKFCEWISSARDNEMAVWAVNETSKGRSYLVESILKGLGQLDYSKMTEKDLLTQIGYGAACFLHTKNYTGWDDFLNHYAKQPLPVRLVNRKVSKVYPFDFKLPCSGDGLIVATKADGSLDIPERVLDPEAIIDFFSMFIDPREYGPFTSYRFLISGIYLWYLALDGARERAKEHPETEGFLYYHAATDTQMAELCQKLAPKDYRLPDENQAWQKLEQSLKKRLEATAAKYDDLYPQRSVLKDDVLGDDILKESYLAAQEGLLEGVNYWKSKAYEAVVAGLKGQLGNSLLRIVKDDFIDAERKQDPQFANLWQKAKEIYKPKTSEERQKLLDRIKRLRDKIQWKEPLDPSDRELFNSLKEVLVSATTPLSLDREIETEDGDNYCLGDMIEDRQAQGFVENIKESIDLKRLGFNKDELKPRELLVLDELRDAARKGYTKDSKEGLSLRQYWTDEKVYQSKMKMLKRLEAKRNKP